MALQQNTSNVDKFMKASLAVKYKQETLVVSISFAGDVKGKLRMGVLLFAPFVLQDPQPYEPQSLGSKLYTSCQ